MSTRSIIFLNTDMASLFLFLNLFCIASVIECRSSYYRIIGGCKANIKNFPYHVSIKVNTTLNGVFTSTNICGGAIITEKFVITAAHCICFIPIQIEQLIIYAGSTKLSRKGHTYPVEHAECHEDYTKENKSNDIGIIGVKNEIIFRAGIQPIKILKDEIPLGTWLTVSGWGHTTSPNGQSSDTLQMLKLQIVNITECSEVFKETLTDKQICTFANMNKDTCNGDSGGPLTFKGLLVGLVSSGTKVCASGKPAINTKVSKYIKWIKITIIKYCQNRTCPNTKLFPKFIKLRTMLLLLKNNVF